MCYISAAATLFAAESLPQHARDMQAADDSAAVIDARKACVAAKQTYMEEAQLRFKLPPAQQQELQQLILTVFQAACKQLEQDHAGLIEVDKENARVLNNRQAPFTTSCLLHPRPWCPTSPVVLMHCMAHCWSSPVFMISTV